MISVSTQRFGAVKREENELITFSDGIFGFELQQNWLFLGDREHGGLYWLQQVDDSDLSFAVVDPREFVSDYALHVKRVQLDTIWNGTEQLIIVSVLTEYENRLHLNLCHPIVINPNTRLGRQVVVTNDRPLQYALPEQPVSLPKIA